MKRPSLRQLLLLAGLAGSAALVIADRPSGLAEAAKPLPASRPGTLAPALASLPAVLGRDAYRQPGQAELFASPPPPSANVLPAPPASMPPTAPPLPYKVLGKQLGQQGWMVFLSRGEQIVLAHAGERLDEQYEVVAIAPPRLDLRYLPLDSTQTLNIGPAFND